MSNILIPKHSANAWRDPKDGADWEFVETTLPQGFRKVGTVDRPNGDVYDLGQNAEGMFAIFRRSTDPWAAFSHCKPERLSDDDLQGFGLLRAVCYEPDEEQGEFSSLCKTHLIGGEAEVAVLRARLGLK